MSSPKRCVPRKPEPLRICITRNIHCKFPISVFYFCRILGFTYRWNTDTLLSLSPPPTTSTSSSAILKKTNMYKKLLHTLFLDFHLSHCKIYKNSYLGLSECISNDAVNNMNHREHKYEYMQLVDSISRYKSHFPLSKSNDRNQNRFYKIRIIWDY